MIPPTVTIVHCQCCFCTYYYCFAMLVNCFRSCNEIFYFRVKRSLYCPTELFMNYTLKLHTELMKLHLIPLMVIICHDCCHQMVLKNIRTLDFLYLMRLLVQWLERVAPRLPIFSHSREHGSNCHAIMSFSLEHLTGLLWYLEDLMKY